MITVNGTLTKVDGTAIVDDILFELVDAKGISTTATVDGVIIATKTIVSTDALGVFTVDLYPNDSILKDTKYKVSNGAVDDIFYIFVTSLTNPVDIDELDSIIPRHTVPTYELADVGKALTVISTTEHGWVAGAGTGDMTKAVYDTTANGIVDNAELVGGFSVGVSVPAGAVFTDTTYTDANIKTKYEANLDTNAFTDALLSKLNGVEASATADQSGAEIKTAYELEANTNAYTDAEKTKLAGVADSANNYTHPTGDGNLHVPANSTTNSGKVLTASATAGVYTWETSASGVTDHTLLTNIGTNTHVQIDSHIADSTLHFTQAAISITESQISDLGTYETADATIVKDADIGVTVQAYDVDTAKLDVAQTFTAAQTIPLSLNAQVGTTYTAVLTDADKIITLNNAAAIAMTIPANASVAYPIGTKLNFMQLGAGAVTIGITTDTLSYDSALTAVLNGQYAVATAVKVTSTSWVLFGNLAAV